MIFWRETIGTWSDTISSFCMIQSQSEIYTVLWSEYSHLLMKRIDNPILKGRSMEHFLPFNLIDKFTVIDTMGLPLQNTALGYRISSWYSIFSWLIALSRSFIIDRPTPLMTFLHWLYEVITVLIRQSQLSIMLKINMCARVCLPFSMF